MLLRRSRSNCGGPSSSQTGRYRLLFCSNVFFRLGIVLLMTLQAHAQRLPIKKYTTADGLAHNTVNKIVRGYAFTNQGSYSEKPARFRRLS